MKHSKTDVHSDEAWSANDTAKYLKLSVKTIYSMANAGQLPHQKAGSKLLFSKATVIAWLQGSTLGGDR